MTRILVTNDDGYRSDGIRVLADALRACGDVTIVAPVEEASAIGHALTLRHPLRLERIDAHTCAVDGTPTDCVNIAVTQVLHALPELVVSGINKGWNLGDDVTYSGTVAGAFERARELERDGDPGHTEQRTFECARHGAGVRHVVAEIPALVDARDDKVRQPAED